MLWYSVECSINSSIYNSIYNNLLTLLCGSLSYLLIFYVNVECAYAKQDIALKMSFTDVFIPGYMQINSVDKIVWLLFQMNYKLQNRKPQNIFVFHTWCKAFQILQHIMHLPEVVKSVLNTIFCIQICVIRDKWMLTYPLWCAKMHFFMQSYYQGFGKLFCVIFVHIWISVSTLEIRVYGLRVCSYIYKMRYNGQLQLMALNVPPRNVTQFALCISCCCRFTHVWMMLFYYIEELFNYKENKHHFALLSGVYKMLFQDFLHGVSDPTNM